MTVEFWRNAELFYELWIVFLSILMILMVTVVIFIFSYATKENRQKSLFIASIPAIFIGVIGFAGHARYAIYLEQASYVNPLIRDREPRLHIYHPYSTSEQLGYAQLNDLESLQKMTLYDEEQIIHPINYLGQDENYYYFQHEDDYLFKQSTQIKFVETAEKAQLIGSHFTLKDEAFKEIGFKNPSSTMFDHIQIPISEEGKRYEPDDFIPKATDKIQQWNF